MYCLILNYFTELSLNLLVQHGDIEIKSGLKGKYSQYHTFGHWNWNSLPAHNYAKVPLLHTFNTLINLIWFVSQKHILILQFQLRRSYKLIGAAHHGNIKRSWVYIYIYISQIQVFKISQLKYWPQYFPAGSYAKRKQDKKDKNM